MPSIFMYVVDRDFGFAPNPFHGLCTLATCKPRIRGVAQADDWVVGMGGARLKAKGRCVFAMKVSRVVTFDQYWNGLEYRDKRPLRNGSMKMIVGDNIYHRAAGSWQQLDSHHSMPDGSPNQHNINNDTQADAVLVSDHFYYFGSSALVVPIETLEGIGYTNGRNHRRFDLATAQPLIDVIAAEAKRNVVAGDPFDFAAASARYSVNGNKVTL